MPPFVTFPVFLVPLIPISFHQIGISFFCLTTFIGHRLEPSPSPPLSPKSGAQRRGEGQIWESIKDWRWSLSCVHFFFMFSRWAGPRPHIPFPSRPHFVCKFSRHGSSSPVTSHLAPSITVLVLPDFADAYSRTTASYRLTQLSGQIPESSQFLGASRLPLLE